MRFPSAHGEERPQRNPFLHCANPFDPNEFLCIPPDRRVTPRSVRPSVASASVYPPGQKQCHPPANKIPKREARIGYLPHAREKQRERERALKGTNGKIKQHLPLFPSLRSPVHICLRSANSVPAVEAINILGGAATWGEANVRRAICS